VQRVPEKVKALQRVVAKVRRRPRFGGAFAGRATLLAGQTYFFSLGVIGISVSRI
jgi:hypothetical protein